MHNCVGLSFHVFKDLAAIFLLLFVSFMCHFFAYEAAMNHEVECSTSDGATTCSSQWKDNLGYPSGEPKVTTIGGQTLAVTFVCVQGWCMESVRIINHSKSSRHCELQNVLPADIVVEFFWWLHQVMNFYHESPVSIHAALVICNHLTRTGCRLPFCSCCLI